MSITELSKTIHAYSIYRSSVSTLLDPCDSTAEQLGPGRRGPIEGRVEERHVELWRDCCGHPAGLWHLG